MYNVNNVMTYEPGADKVRRGLESVDIYVKSYSDLLAEARRYNDDIYRMYGDIELKKIINKELLQKIDLL